MSSKNIPNKYVILKCKLDSGDFYVILSGYYGGYTTGDSWKLSSGIDKVVKDGDIYKVITNSGSTYEVRKDNQGFTNLTSCRYAELQENNTIEVVDIDDLKLGNGNEN